MNKAEIQAEITVMERHLAARETEVRHIEEQIAVARNQLAEAEKPKLRHGDCNIENQTMAKAEGNINNILWSDHHGYSLSAPACDKIVPDFNVYDDLTALSKNMTEFEVVSPTEPDRTLNIHLTGARFHVAEIDLRVDGVHRECFFLSAETLSELILNLQIMKATMKRQKNG